MRKMKDFSALIVISLICVCIVGGSVLAEDGEYNRRKRIASKGVFDYSSSTVVIDSSDLIYLADEIDELERAYKSSTVEALNRIGTFYVSTDGDISHECDDNNVSPDMAAELSFSDLHHGIIKSQSVDHLDNVQAEDADGNLLYYADQNADEGKDLASTTTNANDYPVFIRPAAANNLTAGSAAWVDGDLIIGNGGDNTAYGDTVIRNFVETGDFETTFKISVWEYKYSEPIKNVVIRMTIRRENGVYSFSTDKPTGNGTIPNHFYQYSGDASLNLGIPNVEVVSFGSIE